MNCLKKVRILTLWPFSPSSPLGPSGPGFPYDIMVGQNEGTSKRGKGQNTLKILKIYFCKEMVFPKRKNSTQQNFMNNDYTLNTSQKCRNQSQIFCFSSNRAREVMTMQSQGKVFQLPFTFLPFMPLRPVLPLFPYKFNKQKC